MRLLEARVTQFRRFKNLTVEGLSSSARLIVLAGPNGSGKSSFFDALLFRHSLDAGIPYNFEDTYYKRSDDNNTRFSGNVVIRTDKGSQLGKGALYMRTAYRNEPEFSFNEISSRAINHQSFTIRMSANDVKVSQNYQKLAFTAVNDALVRASPETTIGQFREGILDDIRKPIREIFPDLELAGIGNPFEAGSFKFRKRQSVQFDYKNLSGGEKAVFDLILDIVTHRSDYQDALYCIDEPESHLSTRIQAQVLKQLINVVPDDSQIIIASHSIGMMKAALDLYRSDEKLVSFIDFGGANFDCDVVLVEAKPNRAFWGEVMRVALDDLSALVAPSTIVVCEGDPHGANDQKNPSFDASIYSNIFSAEFPDVEFVSAGNSIQIRSDYVGISSIIPKIVSGVKVVSVIDRDDLSDHEVQSLKIRGIKVLSMRNIEAYIYDDEVLAALCNSVNRSDMIPTMLIEKQKALNESIHKGNPADDIKKASGQIYVAAKRILSLRSAGNDSSAFARDTLSILIRPEMKIYQRLKDDIFGA